MEFLISENGNGNAAAEISKTRQATQKSEREGTGRAGPGLTEK